MPGRARRSVVRQPGDALAEMGDRLGGVAVCADLEGVLVLDLEQVPDLGRAPAR
jgi:hypothetical protein